MSFWASKLNGQQAPAPTVQPSRSLYSGLYQAPPTPEPPRPQEAVYTPAARLIQGSTCPGCGSNNYRPSVGSYAIACPECGYHPRFEQSGYGERSLRTDHSPATPARQAASTQTMQGAIATLNAGGGERL